MHRTPLVLVFILLGAGRAFAQPVPPPPPAPPAPPPPPAPPIEVDPFAEAPVAVEDAVAPPIDDAPIEPPPNDGVPPDDRLRGEDHHRRPRVTLGLGIGFMAPGFSGSLAPNIAGARIRFGRGITLEPTLVASSGSGSSTDNGISTTSSFYEVGAGLNVRIPVRRRGRVELSFVAGASAHRWKETVTGEDNDSNSSTVQASWGLGLDYALGRHWGVSMTMMNPLLTRQAYTFEHSAVDTRRTSYGVRFEPVVSAMIHLYL